MGGLFTDNQIVLVGNKTYPGFHIPSWMSMTIDETSIGRRDKKWFLIGSASSVQ